MAELRADDLTASRPSLSARTETNDSVSSSSSKSLEGAVSKTAYLARSLNHSNRHPLSPDLTFVANRTSYFKPSPSLITSVDTGPNALFKDDDVCERDVEIDGSEQLAGQAQFSSVPDRLAKPPGSTIIRLPRPPHLIEAEDLKRRTIGEHGPEIAISLVQELSKQVSTLQADQEQYKRVYQAKESALRQLLKECSTGQVTEGRVNRALLRAAVESAEAYQEEKGCYPPVPWIVSVAPDLNLEGASKVITQEEKVSLFLIPRVLFQPVYNLLAATLVPRFARRYVRAQLPRSRSYTIA